MGQIRQPPQKSWNGFQMARPKEVKSCRISFSFMVHHMWLLVAIIYPYPSGGFNPCQKYEPSQPIILTMVEKCWKKQ
jgi:hypothetical protein